MTPESSDHQATKPRRRPSSKAANRQPAKKVKSTIHLTVEASQRLDIHVAMTPGSDRSSLLEELINTHLRRYVVADRGGPTADPEELPETSSG